MAAVVADVFGITLPARQEANAVGREEADQRMADRAGVGLLFEETVTAVTGVLDETVPHSDGTDTMPEQPACVSNFLGEARAGGESIRAGWENQRVTAPDADVFVNAVAVGQAHICVMDEKTGQGMAHVCPGPVFTQILGAAAASAWPAARVLEHLVVDDVSPHRAAEADQSTGGEGRMRGDRVSVHMLLYTS